MNLLDYIDDPRIKATPSAGGLLGVQSPDVARMPQMALPPLPHAEPSLLDRLKGRLGGLLGGISDSIRPQAPGGYEGLLSPEEIQRARPSLLQSLIGAPDSPGASERYQQNLNGVAERKMATLQLAQQQQAMQRKQALIDRLHKQFPDFPTMTPEQQKAAVTGIFGEMLKDGLFDEAGKVASTVGAMQKGETQFKLPFKDVEMGGKIERHYPDGRVELIDKYPTAKSPETAAAERSFQASQTDKVLDDFRSDTKDFDKVMQGWDVLVGATKNPTLATPFAVTDAYARITNPGGIVRPTTMEMIDQMGSVGQRMRKYWEHNANGALPPDILRDFQKTLYNIVVEHKKKYDDVRKKAILRARDKAGMNIEPYLSSYELIDPTAPAPRAGGAAARVNPLLGGH